MAGDPHPINEVIEDGSNVPKGDVRGYMKARTLLVIASASELRSFDLANQLMLAVLTTGLIYEVDAADTTTPDDGVGNIRDANNLLFVSIGDLGGGGSASTYREHTAAGDVAVQATDRIIGVNKASGAATGVPMPAAADREGVPLTIKDVKGDADSNPITITFDGSELADGLSSISISNPYGWVTLYPRTGGYYMGP